MVHTFLAGGVFVSCWVIAHFFYRFWQRRADSLFLQFSLAFFLLGIERIVLVVSFESEFSAYAYVIRLIAFSLIVAGIIKKIFRKRMTKKNRLWVLTCQQLPRLSYPLSVAAKSAFSSCKLDAITIFSGLPSQLIGTILL